MNSFERLLPKVQKPSRYAGGEWNSVSKDWDGTDVKLALSYPDVYEIGMSNLAVQLLYAAVNDLSWALAERVFSPWRDMSEQLEKSGLPLAGLETRHPLAEFDVIGFSVGHELTYTNVLGILKHGHIPLRSSDRKRTWPLVIAGGSCAYNPEPMSDFVDAFVIGEGEEAIVELLAAVRDLKQRGASRQEILRALSKLDGVYVPSLYDVEYAADDTISAVRAIDKTAPARIRRRTLGQLPALPKSFVVPYLEAVQDRAAVEIQRGCSRGCRFCQAGIIYRPVRCRSVEDVMAGFRSLVSTCGYSELSPLSLSTSDYPWIGELLRRVTAEFSPGNIAISLPSLRLDSFSLSLMEALPQKRKLTLTFAPEAGTERLRRTINKDISDQEIFDGIAMAADKGWTNVKLYFMIGLPTETDQDVQGIVDLVVKAQRLGGRRKNLRVTLSTLVPKPQTVFQRVAQIGAEDAARKQMTVKKGLSRYGVHVSFPDYRASQLEGILARGDRRLGRVIETAFESGCVFDAWSESFNWEKWRAAFEKCGLSPEFYSSRERGTEEVLPWAHIDVGVSEQFLKKEYQRALDGIATPDCNSGNYAGKTGSAGPGNPSSSARTVESPSPATPSRCNLCGLQGEYEGCRKKVASSD